MSDGEAPGRIGRLEIEAAIARLIATGALAPGSRALALLDYLARHWLASGPDAPVKAHAIAVDVLGRGEDFDPATDSIVRVEIGRLRKLLDAHAAGPGREDRLVLSLPKGGNALAVTLRDTTRPASPAPGSPIRRIRLAAAALTILAAAAAPLLLDRENSHPVPLHPPVLVIAPATNAVAEPGLAWLAPGLEAQVVADLSGYRGLRVRQAQALTGPGLATGDYVLHLSVTGTGPRLLLAATLTRMTDGTAILSRRTELDPAAPDFASVLLMALRDLAVQIASPGGVVAAETRAKLPAAPEAPGADDPSDFLCLLRFQSFDLSKSPADERAARTCLAGRIAAGSREGAIWAAHAFLIFLDWSRSGGTPQDPALDAALAAASRAVALDPTGPDGHEAMSSILLARGQIEEAGAALEKASRFNPSNPELRVKLGWQKCRAGDWEGGIAELRAAMAEVGFVPGWYRIPLALDAFRRGEHEVSLEQARLILASGDRRGEILALAATLAGEVPDRRAATLAALHAKGFSPAPALAELRALFDAPDLIAAYDAILSR